MLVDDDQLVLAMLRVAVRVNRLGKVVAEAESSVDANRLAARKRPDVIVLDLSLADATGRGVFTSLRAAAPASRIVIYTGHESEPGWYERRGATFVPKSSGARDLIAALKTR